MFLDTSALIEYVSGDEKIIDKIEDANDVKASSISFFELFRGALRSDHSEHNIEVVEKDLDWIEKIGVQGEAVEEAAKIEKKLEEKGEKINLADILTAASAKTNSSKILSADGDFQKIDGLETEMIK